MKCPIDSATFVMSERSGVEIDYCPECRGVWLDRGELDKILDRAEKEVDRPAVAGDGIRPVASRFGRLSLAGSTLRACRRGWRRPPRNRWPGAREARAKNPRWG